MVTYKKSYFPGGSNIYPNIITYQGRIISVNTQKLRIILVPQASTSHRNGQIIGNDSPTFVLAKHQKIHPEGSKELQNLPMYKNVNTKYGKFPSKQAEKISRNKQCVDIIGPYVIRRK